MKNIVLTGFMTSGKTTVGKAIAKKLNLIFYDTDMIIEEQEGKPISDIINESGEKYYREVENKLAITLKDTQNAVIATGSGFVIEPKNIELMRQNGVIINLKITPEILGSRINNESIDEVIDRFNQQKIYYNNNDITIKLNEDTSIEECIDLVIEAYREFTGEEI